MTWEYKFIVIGIQRVRSAADTTAGPNRTRNAASQNQPTSGWKAENREPSTLSQLYRDLEFPNHEQQNPAPSVRSNVLPRAKQLEQAVNKLAAEGWEYVGLELMMGEQLLVMRRAQLALQESNGEAASVEQRPFWLRWRRSN